MNIALILSGGTGDRVGIARPKQYVEVGGKPIFAYSYERFERHERIDKIQIAADGSWRNFIMPWTGAKFSGFSRPGANRQMSLFNGLRDILKYAAQTDRVIIHDAARPCVTGRMITDCLAALEGHDGVVPVLPMNDTVYEGENGRILSLLDRGRILAGQAPECFVLGKYYQANRALLPEKILSIHGSTEPAVMADMDVVYIPGEEGNFKITTKADLERFEQLAEGENRREGICIARGR